MSDFRPAVPKGTFDVLPEDAVVREGLIVGVAEKLFRQFGYGRIETPIFESSELFARGVGATTDVVSKEMFSFEDQGGRSLALRPEGTAAVCRAYIENGMHKLQHPVKLWYSGPFFRQEAPQAGRYRQFTQIGVEVFGEADPFEDVGVILLLDELISEACEGETTLRLNSLGSAEARNNYSTKLIEYLESNSTHLSEDVQKRMHANPLRAFDSKHEGTREVMENAPRLIDHISTEDRAYHDTVVHLIDELSKSGTLKSTVCHDTTLVRGLDYYEKTVFEFVSDALGAQSALGGGGRYDGLIAQLGGTPTGGVGWAAGVERMLLTAQNDVLRAYARPSKTLFIADEGGGDDLSAIVLGSNWRMDGEANTAIFGSPALSIRNQTKRASRLGAEFLVILGGERGTYDATVQHMKTRNEVEVTSTKDDFASAVMAEIKNLTSKQDA